jgi:hypothetical protein
METILRKRGIPIMASAGVGSSELNSARREVCGVVGEGYENTRAAS